MLLTKLNIQKIFYAVKTKTEMSLVAKRGKRFFRVEVINMNEPVNY